MTDQVLTVREVAELLKLAEKTVYSMAQRGEIPAFKVRGQWRIQRTDLQAWIESQKHAGVEAAPDRSAAAPEEGSGRTARSSRPARPRTAGGGKAR